MDKNIVALIREDCRTVRVKFNVRPFVNIDGDLAFEGSSAEYSYVTDRDDLGIGDLVVVEARGHLNVACITHIDDDVEILPNSDIEYKWIIDRVSLEMFIEAFKRNEAISEKLSSAYKKRMRAAFSREMLGELGMDAEEVKKLLAP